MDRQTRRRLRPALSCTECRRRKIKCDRGDPCAHCVSAKAACLHRVHHNEILSQQHGVVPSASAPIPSPPPARQADIGGLITELESHLPRPPSITTSATAPVAPVAPAANDGQTTTNNNDARSREQFSDAGPNLYEILTRVQKLEQSLGPTPIQHLTENARDILASKLGLRESQIILNKTRILRWSHWVGTGQELAPIIDCFAEACGSSKEASFAAGDAETMAFVAEMGELLRKCKAIARSSKAGRPSRSLAGHGEIELTPPPRQVADAMAGLYFQSFESVYRILHIPTFWADYRRFWDQPESVATDLRLKVLLVISIGSSLTDDHKDADAGFQGMVHQWIYAAQAWLAGPLEKDRLDITGLQIFCLTIMARQIYSIGGDLVWITTGSLIHTAMQIGLHRDPKHLPAMSSLQSELRRRLWATVLEMAVQSSLDSAMPPRISFDEFDTEPPSNNNDDEMDESVASLKPHPRDTLTSTSMQLMLLDSLPTRLRVLQVLNGLHSELSYLDVLGLSTMLTETYQQISSFVRRHEKSSGMTPFHRNHLDYLVRRFMIPLHCPFASRARTNPLFHYSLKATIDAAMAIVCPETDDGFSRIMAIGGGMFREGIRYAMSVISLELVAQAEAQRLDGTLHRVSQHRELLKQIVRDMIALSEERIRQGETNIKAHMFLCMVLAQAEATEEGVPCTRRVARSGRDSLVFCHDLLLARAGTRSSSCPTPTTSVGGGQLGDAFEFDLDFFWSDVGFS